VKAGCCYVEFSGLNCCAMAAKAEEEKKGRRKEKV